MKTKLLFCLSALLLLINSSVFAAEEEGDMKASDAEAVVTQCENQYTADAYPNEAERDKLIDQCIAENSPAPAE